jgi:AcrR family transcriptional regulator
MSYVNRTAGLRPSETVLPGSQPVARERRPGREEVRRRLLDAALTVFAESGFANATMDQIAAAAGLTKGAIYSNFASKDDLFFAMMSDQISSRVETVRAALDASPVNSRRRQTLLEIGRILTEAFLKEREWQLVFFDFWQRAVRDDGVRTLFLAHRRVLRSAVADFIAQVLRGAPTPGGLDVEDAVTVVLALSNGLAIEAYVDRDMFNDRLLGQVLELLSAQV